MRCKGLVLFLAVVSIYACHPRISPDLGKPTTNAERLLSKLYERNKSLKTFKGIGRIRIWNASGSQSARMAWLGEVGGRLRVEILGPSGRPLMKLAYDGAYLYHYSMDGEGVEKHKARNPGLGHVIDVPVSIHELVFFLGGRFPVYAHGRVQLRQTGPSRTDQLLLRRPWCGVIEKIALTEDHTAVESVSIYDWRGLSYRARLSEYRKWGDFSIPGRILISNSKSAGFEIRINRYWPNVDVKDRQFAISPA